MVRGADLLDATPWQIALQRALGYPTPTYTHIPLVTNPDGSKLGKRDGSLPLPTLRAYVRHSPPRCGTSASRCRAAEMLAAALARAIVV